MVWKKVAEKGSISNGKSNEFDIDGKKIAIFHHDGWYALDASCIHQDQSITCGKIEDDIIECPHHFWHYNLKTGELLDYLKDAKLGNYKIKEKNDGIYIDI